MIGFPESQPPLTKSVDSFWMVIKPEPTHEKLVVGLPARCFISIQYQMDFSLCSTCLASSAKKNGAKDYSKGDFRCVRIKAGW